MGFQSQGCDVRLGGAGGVPYQGDEVGQGDLEGDGNSLFRLLHWPPLWVIVVEEMVVKTQLLVLRLTSAWGWGQVVGSQQRKGWEGGPLCRLRVCTGLCCMCL